MKQKIKRMPLSMQLMMAMAGLVVGIIGLFWLMNHSFLTRYYQYSKQQELQAAFHVFDQASQENKLDKSNFDVEFERICANGNVNTMIIDQDQRIVRVSSMDMRDFQWELLDVIMAPDEASLIVVEETDNYTIARRADERLQADYLILTGKLSGGEYVYMRTAMESIQESAKITNRFLLWLAIAALIISAIVIFFLSKSISSPISRMTHLSKQMADLEFDARYIPQKSDSREIDELGYHMNEMSQALEETISELKAANNALKADIQEKEQIDEMRKEFLSNVSHELKTPLALIQGYAEGLKEFADDPESRDFYTDVIIDETEKMNRMVKKLLVLNQLEFGNEKLEMSRFNLTELCQGLITANSLLTSQSGIRMIFEQTAPVYVWGDEFKVEEVITNYLSNAMHHADGAKEIRVFFTEHDGLLRLSVYNTGKTIPDEDLEKIWIKFYKVDKAHTREYGGSGIGLSIVKAIMDSMHQKYGVLNHEDGVEFWMELEVAS